MTRYSFTRGDCCLPDPEGDLVSFEDFQKVRQALDALVTVARPSFPRSPYRLALDHAERVLKETAEAV